MKNEQVIFTIGCSTHQPVAFMELLQRFQITVLVDVRSVPFSRHTPHFNQQPLSDLLTANGVQYLYMGIEFGARRSEPEVYEHGRVDFERVFETPSFQRGVQRIEMGLSKGFQIALMCTEKDPIDCHRAILLTRYLSEHFAYSIHHIHFCGRLETNQDFEARLKDVMGVSPDLFSQDEKVLRRQAYNLRAKRIAWCSEGESKTVSRT